MSVPRDVWLLGTVSLLNDLSSEGIFALLPYYLTVLGGGPELVGGTWGGMELVKSVLNVVSGRTLGRPGRAKAAVALGYGFSAVMKTLLAFPKDPTLVGLIASLERVGKGVRTPPRDAILAGLAGRKPGVVFGIHRAMDTAGAVLGALLAAAMLVRGIPARTAVLALAIAGFLPLIPLAPVRERLRDVEGHGTEVRLHRVLLAVGLYRLGAVGWMMYSLKVLGTAGPVGAALAYAGFSTLHALASVPAGRLSDRIGPALTLSIGYAATALSAATAGIGLATLAFLLYGTAYGIVDAVERAAVARLAGTAASYGAYHALVGVCSLACGLTVGWLWQTVSPRVAFLYSACLTGIAAAAVALLGPGRSGG